MSLEIDYKLTGIGWAKCTIADGENSCTITASDLSDALGDLVLSAIALLRWCNSLSFSFQEEPGELRWIFTSRFTSTGRNDFELKILDFDDQFRQNLEADGRLLFQTVCTPLTFGNAVHKAATTVLEEYGEAVYFAKWSDEYPFPTEGLNELTRLLAKLPASES